METKGGCCLVSKYGTATDGARAQVGGAVLDGVRQDCSWSAAGDRGWDGSRRESGCISPIQEAKEKKEMGLGAEAPAGGSRTAMPTPWCKDEGEGIDGDCFLQEQQL
jgi:hypothetical protein